MHSPREKGASRGVHAASVPGPGSAPRRVFFLSILHTQIWQDSVTCNVWDKGDVGPNIKLEAVLIRPGGAGAQNASGEDSPRQQPGRRWAGRELRALAGSGTAPAPPQAVPVMTQPCIRRGSFPGPRTCTRAPRVHRASVELKTGTGKFP